MRSPEGRRRKGPFFRESGGGRGHFSACFCPATAATMAVCAPDALAGARRAAFGSSWQQLAAVGSSRRRSRRSSGRSRSRSKPAPDTGGRGDRRPYGDQRVPKRPDTARCSARAASHFSLSLSLCVCAECRVSAPCFYLRRAAALCAPPVLSRVSARG